MYICLCQAVTDKTIEEAINNGTSSVQELMNELNIATQCGCCLNEVARLVQNYSEEKINPEPICHSEVQLFVPATTAEL